MHCIVVRHGHAEWPNYTGRDFDRPLTPQGTAQARATAHAIAAAGLHPALVLASPALRTRQTAGLIAAELGLGADAIHFVDELYNAGPAILEAALRSARGKGLPLLVAHNPGVSELARQLTDDPHAPPFAPADWRHLALDGTR